MYTCILESFTLFQTHYVYDKNIYIPIGNILMKCGYMHVCASEKKCFMKPMCLQRYYFSLIQQNEWRIYYLSISTLGGNYKIHETSFLPLKRSQLEKKTHKPLQHNERTVTVEVYIQCNGGTQQGMIISGQKASQRW